MPLTCSQKTQEQNAKEIRADRDRKSFLGHGLARWNSERQELEFME